MNWPALIGFGMGTLRLSPAAFWSMTPRELTLAARALTGPAPAIAPPMEREAMAALRARYPDIAHDP